MNYHQPRPIFDGPNAGKWHYTCRNDDRVWAEGYCSPWESCPECKDTEKMWDLSRTDDCEVCHGKRLVEKEHPCPGHDTPEEACEHYRQYQLDSAVYTHEILDQQLRCEICGEFTQKLATIPGTINDHILCYKHCNREGLDNVLKIGHSMGSY